MKCDPPTSRQNSRVTKKKKKKSLPEVNKNSLEGISHEGRANFASMKTRVDSTAISGKKSAHELCGTNSRAYVASVELQPLSATSKLACCPAMNFQTKRVP